MRSPTLIWSGTATTAAAVSLGAALASSRSEPPGVDQWWNEAVDANRADWMLSLALALDHLGGGWVAILVVPSLVIIGLLLARRRRGALFAASAFLASAGVVQLLKNLYGRARPDDMVIASDFGAFPSGHAANATTLAVALYLLFPRAWVAIAGAVWAVTMALSRTLLSVHWATDTLGGALVGAGVPLLLAAWVRRREAGRVQRTCDHRAAP